MKPIPLNVHVSTQDSVPVCEVLPVVKGGSGTR